MPMDDKGGMSGYSKPKNKPNSKEKISTRKLTRKESGVSAQKFYVKTRMAEAAKSGKTLDRAALRQKFQSGDVARKGFGAPKKKSTGSTTPAPYLKPSAPATKTGSRYQYQATDRGDAAGRKGVASVAKKMPASTASKGTAMRSADAYGSSKGPVKSAPRKTRFKSKYDNSPSGLQKIGGFLKGIQNDSGTRYVNGVKVKKKK